MHNNNNINNNNKIEKKWKIYISERNIRNINWENILNNTINIKITILIVLIMSKYILKHHYNRRKVN